MVWTAPLAGNRNLTSLMQRTQVAAPLISGVGRENKAPAAQGVRYGELRNDRTNHSADRHTLALGVTSLVHDPLEEETQG